LHLFKVLLFQQKRLQAVKVKEKDAMVMADMRAQGQREDREKMVTQVEAKLMIMVSML
jgi:hypothetical protein